MLSHLMKSTSAGKSDDENEDTIQGGSELPEKRV
jgi:hypothetical protein